MTNTRLQLTLKGINENSIFLIQNLAAVLFKFICKTETNEKQDIKQLCLKTVFIMALQKQEKMDRQQDIKYSLTHSF